MLFNPELIGRSEHNPVITVNDIPGGAARVCNSGFVVHEGKVYGLLHTPDRRYRMRFLLACSEDGINFEIYDKDILPDVNGQWFCQGMYDIRITPLEGRYYFTCNVGHDSYGTRILLNVTDDFDKFETLGFITAPSQRNCVLFSEKIGGLYARLERPHGGGTNGDIYISFSPDLKFWGETSLLYARGRHYWESHKVGPGAPPIKTDEGWLLIYHGTSSTCSGLRYYAGCMLLDLENPGVIRGAMDEYLFAPETQYEMVGHTMNVVFPTSAIRFDDKDTLNIYYGAADCCICLAKASVNELVDACLKNPYKQHWHY